VEWKVFKVERKVFYIPEGMAYEDRERLASAQNPAGEARLIRAGFCDNEPPKAASPKDFAGIARRFQRRAGEAGRIMSV
jgi:hypothetical protein